MPSGPITTHVLDTARGIPAAGIPVVLEYRSDAAHWQVLGISTTDADGRVSHLLPSDALLLPGAYRLTFSTGEYLARISKEPVFYPEIQIAFVIPPDAVRQHYHIPLLLTPYGYTTYRGS